MGELQVIDAEPEVLDAEVIESLSKKDAQALDKKIRSASDKITTTMNKAQENYETLIELLEQAQQGNIHTALEYASWPAYLADAVQVQISGRDERKMLVTTMSAKGISTRAIGKTLGISQTTAYKDAKETEEQAPDTVTGLDGRTFNKKKPKKVVEDGDAPQAKAASIADDYRTEIFNLKNDVQSLREIVEEDERFPKARARLAKLKITDDLRQVTDDLWDLLGVINGEEEAADEAVEEESA